MHGPRLSPSPPETYKLPADLQPLCSEQGERRPARQRAGGRAAASPSRSLTSRSPAGSPGAGRAYSERTGPAVAARRCGHTGQGRPLWHPGHGQRLPLGQGDHGCCTAPRPGAAGSVLRGAGAEGGRAGASGSLCPGAGIRCGCCTEGTRQRHAGSEPGWGVLCLQVEGKVITSFKTRSVGGTLPPWAPQGWD